MQHPGARGYLRKALEATTAVRSPRATAARRCSRHYLRIVPYGNRIHGIAYAARRYLDKPVDDLSWAEVAFLAAIPQSPSRMDPYDPRGRLRAIRRGREILARLADARRALRRVDLAAALAEIDAAAPALASGERPRPRSTRCSRSTRRCPAERRARPAAASTTTLDLDLQREVEGLAWRAVRDAADRGAGNAAVLVVDRAALGGAWRRSRSTGYFDADRAGAIDYLRLPRSLRARRSSRCSSRQALERGTITPATVLDDLEPGPGGILNSDDALPRTDAAARRARQLAQRPGGGAAARARARRRLRASSPTSGCTPTSGPRARYGLGLAIGSLPVTLERLVTAYTTLAGDGRLQRAALARPAADGGRPRAPRRRLARRPPASSRSSSPIRRRACRPFRAWASPSTRSRWR